MKLGNGILLLIPLGKLFPPNSALRSASPAVTLAPGWMGAQSFHMRPCCLTFCLTPNFHFRSNVTFYGKPSLTSQVRSPVIHCHLPVLSSWLFITAGVNLCELISVSSINALSTRTEVVCSLNLQHEAQCLHRVS